MLLRAAYACLFHGLGLFDLHIQIAIIFYGRKIMYMCCLPIFFFNNLSTVLWPRYIHNQPGKDLGKASAGSPGYCCH